MDRDRLRHRQTDKAPYSGGSRDSRFSVGPSLECRSSRFVGKAAKVRAQRQGAFPKSALIRGRQGNVAFGLSRDDNPGTPTARLSEKRDDTEFRIWVMSTRSRRLGFGSIFGR